MRMLILAGAAGLALTACKQGDTAQERAAAEQNVETAIVATNDVTAIDAATGQAANMAADVQYMPDDMNVAEDAAATPASNSSAPAKPQPKRSTPRPAARPKSSEPARSEPAADTAPANGV